jgi:hypothetical protein
MIKTFRFLIALLATLLLIGAGAVDQKPVPAAAAADQPDFAAVDAYV